MKKNLLLVLILNLTLFTSFASGNKGGLTAPTDRIEVLYFHGKQRCITCNAIEKLTREVLDSKFAGELKSGKIVMKVIDISQSANEQIAEKYEVTWSSLFLNQWQGSREKVNNFTDFGFKYAKNQPEKFKDGLESKLHELLK